LDSLVSLESVGINANTLGHLCQLSLWVNLSLVCLYLAECEGVSCLNDLFDLFDLVVNLEFLVEGFLAFC
jgi:hypothetical protein